MRTLCKYNAAELQDIQERYKRYVQEHYYVHERDVARVRDGIRKPYKMYKIYKRYEIYEIYEMYEMYEEGMRKYETEEGI